MSADQDAEATLQSTTSAPTLGPATGLAWLLMAVPLVVAAVIVFALTPGVGWWLGILVGAFVAALLVYLRWRSALPRLLSALGAEPASPDGHARYFNLVEGLSLAAGIPQPDLYVVPDRGHNLAAAAHRGRSAIVVTAGLLDAVDRIGLEGLMAEALVRIGGGDAEAVTVGSSLLGPFLTGPLAPVTGPIAAMGMGRLLESDRDLLADRAAVALTRYPPGLMAGFDVVRSGSPDVGRRSAATDHAWVVAPASDGAGSRAPLDLRIDVLGEL